MIDLEALAHSFSEPLRIYCGVPQIIGADEIIPVEELITPRIIWNVKESCLTENGTPVINWQAVPGTIDPEHFSSDIKKTVITNPKATFTLILYGNQGDSNNALYIQKAREWFATPFLGPDFLNSYEAVVTDVSEIKYTCLQAGSNEGRGFDVTMRFNDKVSTVIATIEQVEHNGTIQT